MYKLLKDCAEIFSWLLMAISFVDSEIISNVYKTRLIIFGAIIIVGCLVGIIYCKILEFTSQKL